MTVTCVFYVTSFSLEEFTNISSKLAASNFRIDEASFRQKQDGPPRSR
jgi:hypothetical protein